MTTDYRNTTLWKAAFCGADLINDHSAASNKLEVTLDDLEKHVKVLLAKIPEDCRGLTVHDISHIHQLWDVASTICGPGYPINPLEGFVLGAAFLVHDAGLTAAAYPGGVEALQQTRLCKDMFATELKRDNPNLEFTDEDTARATREQKERVLFALLRNIHAERARNLLDTEYVHPITRHSWTLLRPELLFDVGLTIGKIAASHHWDISRVSREFGDPLSPPAAFPGWPIDALKLACILRCADACTIDERRAPVMAFIIENPRGVSRNHWVFQSYLKPAHLPSGQEGLVFESKRPIKREDMDAWWLAYEAIVLADRELRDSDRLLKSRAGQRDHEKKIPLAAKRVEGAGDASVLASFVTVEGWTPVDTAVRINDPMAIVDLFGGKKLYGGDHTAPPRELIQNAADAVRMRRLQNGYDPNEGESAGLIQISIEKNEPNSWVMRVSDDGIGMPEEVLTGPFIEFGKSLWRSDRLHSLYPGLASNPGFNPTGQFGIGFYASFIIGDNVKIMSKPYNGGTSDRRVLHFTSGARRRAELRAYDYRLDSEWSYGQSTIVEINFNTDEWLAQFASTSFHGYFEGPIYSAESRFWEFFSLTLKRLVFCLDVQVELKCPHLGSTFINRSDVFKLSNHEFAEEFNRTFENEKGKIPVEIVPLVDTIVDKIITDKPSKSRGTISVSESNIGIYHIGGLTVFGLGTKSVTGVHQAIPTTVDRRTLRASASSQNICNWGEVQLTKLDTIDLPDPRRAIALLNLHHLGVDLRSKYFLCDLNHEIRYFSDMNLTSGDKLFICCQRHPLVNKVEIGQL